MTNGDMATGRGANVLVAGAGLAGLTAAFGLARAGFDVVCHDFRVQAVTVGKDAQGEVNVEVEHNGQIYRGRGVSTDSVEASAKAFVNAINRVAAHPDPRLHPQHAQ